MVANLQTKLAIIGSGIPATDAIKSQSDMLNTNPFETDCKSL
jgi:hypothetical protein